MLWRAGRRIRSQFSFYILENPPLEEKVGLGIIFFPVFSFLHWCVVHWVQQRKLWISFFSFLYFHLHCINLFQLQNFQHLSCFSMANIPALLVSELFIFRMPCKMRWWHTVICCHTWRLRSKYHSVWLTNWATHDLFSGLFSITNSSMVQQFKAKLLLSSVADVTLQYVCISGS